MRLIAELLEFNDSDPLKLERLRISRSAAGSQPMDR